MRFIKFAITVGGKKDAYEYYVVAKQFDEAIKAMDDGQVTECEENELPPLATPYKPTKVNLYCKHKWQFHLYCVTCNGIFEVLFLI